MRWVVVLFSAFSLAFLLRSAGADDLPEGKGQDVVLRMCLNCHGAETFTANKYSRKRWTSIVDEMVSMGAPGTDEDAETVVSYLTRNFGQPVNINTSTAKQIEDRLSFTAAESQLLVQYRTEKGPFKTYEDLVKVPGLNAVLLDEQKKNILF